MIEPIRDRGTFAELRRRGRRSRSGPVSITAVFDPSRPSVGLAFAISRRVGGAVVRNKVRRRLRSITVSLANGPEPLLCPGVYLISTAPEVVDLTFQELTYAVVAALSALGANDRAGTVRRSDA